MAKKEKGNGKGDKTKVSGKPTRLSEGKKHGELKAKPKKKRNGGNTSFKNKKQD